MSNSFLYLRKSQNETDDPEILAKHKALLLRTATADQTAPALPSRSP